MSKLTYTILTLVSFALCVSAQEKPPAPGPTRPVKIPQVVEKKLPNGLRVVVVERKGSPLVAGRLLLGAGSTMDDLETAGLAKMTLDMLTKGTSTRTATQIADDLEYLGADLSSSVGQDNSAISFDVTSDKLKDVFPIFADVALHPTFPQKELDLAKSQALDELTANLQQPGFLASYVANVYSLYLSPASGTPASLQAMKREQIVSFYKDTFQPNRSVLIFVGDVDPQTAVSLANLHFGKWHSPPSKEVDTGAVLTESASSLEEMKQAAAAQPLLRRILVIDLPKSGQAAVVFAKDIQYAGHITWDSKLDRGEISKGYFPGLVMNSVLGGGYSSRLNLEIRIKRGLSYGAGSSITWRAYDSRFTTRIQTKNESAAEVADLTRDEIAKIANNQVPSSELLPRQATLFGSFSQDIGTNAGLVNAMSGLYSDWLPAAELNNFQSRVQRVNAHEVLDFARQNLMGGDIIIAGDYSIFKSDLAKRFPNVPIQVVEADKLDLRKLQQ